MRLGLAMVKSRLDTVLQCTCTVRRRACLGLNESPCMRGAWMARVSQRVNQMIFQRLHRWPPAPSPANLCINTAQSRLRDRHPGAIGPMRSILALCMPWTCASCCRPDSISKSAAVLRRDCKTSSGRPVIGTHCVQLIGRRAGNCVGE